MTRAECEAVHREAGREISCGDCPNPECRGGLLQATIAAWNLYHDVEAFGWEVATALQEIALTAADSELLLEKFRMIRRFYQAQEERQAWQRKKEDERGSRS